MFHVIGHRILISMLYRICMDSDLVFSCWSRSFQVGRLVSNTKLTFFKKITTYCIHRANKLVCNMILSDRTEWQRNGEKCRYSNEYAQLRMYILIKTLWAMYVIIICLVLHMDVCCFIKSIARCSLCNFSTISIVFSVWRSNPMVAPIWKCHVRRHSGDHAPRSLWKIDSADDRWFRLAPKMSVIYHHRIEPNNRNPFNLNCILMLARNALETKLNQSEHTFGGSPWRADRLFGTTSTIVAVLPSRIKPKHCLSISRRIA